MMLRLICLLLLTTELLTAELLSLQTERLCVLFDAGETTALTPVLKQWEQEGKDFRVLVMATAETLIKPTDFAGHRLTLKDLDIQDEITTTTLRTTELSLEALKKLKQIQPKKVLVGTASRVQEQFLTLFPQAETFAYLDNFDYDKTSKVFETTNRVQAAAQSVLCPSQNIVELFATTASRHRYHVVGKPSIQQWEQQVAAVDRTLTFLKCGLIEHGGRVITFIGGYGPGYDVINPLYNEFACQLTQMGYQVNIQSHPKVAPAKLTIVEALAISDYIVGYNSSVIFDAAFFKNTLYFSPSSTPFDHFAIKNGYITQVHDLNELLRYIRDGKQPANLREALSIPKDSIDIIASFF